MNSVVTESTQVRGPIRYRRPVRRQHSQTDAVDRLRDRIRTALTEYGHNSLRHVEIGIHEGLVQLTGPVQSYYQKQLATAAVFSVDPDSRLQLRNRIHVTTSPGGASGVGAVLRETRIT